jgi:hypothetical protein
LIPQLILRVADLAVESDLPFVSNYSDTPSLAFNDEHTIYESVTYVHQVINLKAVAAMFWKVRPEKQNS